MDTAVTELFGLRYPIFQGGMAWVSDAQLAAAVSNAGGLGIISAMNLSGEYLREQIQKCRELTSKPFGVNIMLMSPFVEETAQVVLEEKVPVVTTGAGFPGAYMKKWVPAGIKVVPVIPSVAIAKRVEREGFSALFDYSYQWAYAKRFEEAGLTALLGTGFDPGVTSVFVSYAKKHYFDRNESVDILDCNGSDPAYPFATNFNP